MRVAASSVSGVLRAPFTSCCPLAAEAAGQTCNEVVTRTFAKAAVVSFADNMTAEMAGGEGCVISGREDRIANRAASGPGPICYGPVFKMQSVFWLVPNRLLPLVRLCTQSRRHSPAMLNPSIVITAHPAIPASRRATLGPGSQLMSIRETCFRHRFGS